MMVADYIKPPKRPQGNNISEQVKKIVNEAFTDIPEMFEYNDVGFKYTLSKNGVSITVIVDVDIEDKEITGQSFKDYRNNL